MKHPPFSSLALLLCSSLVAAQAHAQAPAQAPTQAPTQSIKVRAPRAELQQVCPDARAELPDALAAAAQDVAAHGTVAVQFDIEGSRVMNVQATAQSPGAQIKHVRAVQRAVRGLACSNGDAGRQRVAFNVRFVDPFDRRVDRSVQRADARMVLVEVPATQR
jgi:hypothetical protein